MRRVTSRILRLASRLRLAPVQWAPPRIRPAGTPADVVVPVYSSGPRLEIRKSSLRQPGLESR